MFCVPPRKEGEVGGAFAGVVDVEEPGDRDVIRPIAPADPEDVDRENLEVLGDAEELVARARFADDPVVTERVGEAPGGAGVADVATAAGVEDDSDSRHVGGGARATSWV